MVDQNALLDAVTASLEAITSPHYYEDERGFQGQFYAQLFLRLPELLLPEHALLREEYQKRARLHGLTIRPDIILHEPFNRLRHANREQGNLMVVELKRRANAKSAGEAITSLAKMLHILKYRLGVLVNVDSASTWSELVPLEHRSKIACVAISLAPDGLPRTVMDRPTAD